MRHGLCGCAVPAKPDRRVRATPPGDAHALRPRCNGRLAAAGVRRRLRDAAQQSKKVQVHRSLVTRWRALMLLRWQQARRKQYLNRPDLIFGGTLACNTLLAPWRSRAIAGPAWRWLGCAYRDRHARGASNHSATAAERLCPQTRYARSPVPCRSPDPRHIANWMTW